MKQHPKLLIVLFIDTMHLCKFCLSFLNHNDVKFWLLGTFVYNDTKVGGGGVSSNLTISTHM